MAQIRVDGDVVTIENLEVEDPGLAQLLATQPPDKRAEIATRVITVGVRGILSWFANFMIAAMSCVLPGFTTTSGK